MAWAHRTRPGDISDLRPRRCFPLAGRGDGCCGPDIATSCQCPRFNLPYLPGSKENDANMTEQGIRSPRTRSGQDPVPRFLDVPSNKSLLFFSPVKDWEFGRGESMQSLRWQRIPVNTVFLNLFLKLCPTSTPQRFRCLFFSPSPLFQHNSQPSSEKV